SPAGTLAAPDLPDRERRSTDPEGGPAAPRAADRRGRRRAGASGPGRDRRTPRTGRRLAGGTDERREERHRTRRVEVSRPPAGHRTSPEDSLPVFGSRTPSHAGDR